MFLVRNSEFPPADWGYSLPSQIAHFLLLYTIFVYVHQNKQTESPAPAPAAPPAAAAAPAPPSDAAAQPVIVKRKNRESLSISKSAQESMIQNNDATRPAAAMAGPAPPSAGNGFQGLPQVGSPPTALRELPALRDAPPNKREELFKLKLQLCGVIFSFDDPTSDKRGKVGLDLL